MRLVKTAISILMLSLTFMISACETENEADKEVLRITTEAEENTKESEGLGDTFSGIAESADNADDENNTNNCRAFIDNISLNY